MSSPNGPQPGSTPADETHSNPNPHRTGESLGTVSDVRTSNYPSASGVAGSSVNPTVSGYYMNPMADPNNPYSGQSGVGGDMPPDGTPTAYMSDGLSATYATKVDEYGSVGTAPMPNSNDAYMEKIRIDRGQDDQFVPIEDRR